MTPARRTEDFVWSQEDAGVPVGQGLRFTTDKPGRYELTLKGVCGTLTLSCPVVITVTKTIRLQDDIRLNGVHPDGDQIQYIGRAWVAEEHQIALRRREEQEGPKHGANRRLRGNGNESLVRNHRAFSILCGVMADLAASRDQSSVSHAISAVRSRLRTFRRA